MDYSKPPDWKIFDKLVGTLAKSYSESNPDRPAFERVAELPEPKLMDTTSHLPHNGS